jgi:hypothetical protein
MAVPDRWTLNLRCPVCLKVGEIDFLEDTHSYIRGDALIVEDITAGFDLIRIGTASGGTIVVCSECGEEAF